MDEFKECLNYEDMLRVISVECSVAEPRNLVICVNACQYVENVAFVCLSVESANVKHASNKCEASHGYSLVVE
jgi:hypothetical protein